MESDLAPHARQAMAEAVMQLSPDERLNAFLAHCQLMMVSPAHCREVPVAQGIERIR